MVQNQLIDHGNERLQDIDMLAAAMSNEAYVAPDKRKQYIQNYEYDPELSNTDTAVYHNHATKKTHVSNRGSTSAYDWGVSDVQIALGAEKRGARFQRAVKQTQAAHDKHGYNVSTSGHSLGGRASSYTTEQLGNEDWYESGTGLNPGISTFGGSSYFSGARRACQKKNPPKYCSKQTNLVQEGDYVGGRNLGCAVLTLGMGGKMCRKTQGYGKTKYYTNKKKKFYKPAFFHNLQNHSLNTFDYEE